MTEARGAETGLLSPVETGRYNRTRLLETLYDVGPTSRAELARLTAVTRTTIGSIVQPLLDAGILVEGPPQRASRLGGKPARPLWFSPDGRPLVAVHLVPRTVRVALVSPTGTVLADATGRFPPVRATQPRVLEILAGCVDAVRPSSGRPPLGVGVAVGGMVDTDSGRIVEMNLAPRLAGFEIGRLLSERTGLPTHVDLHPRVQAVGDRWFGLGRGESSFASVYVGEAIGAGLVIDGAVHRGAGGAGGEVGHTVVELGGQVCRCGRRGCWETVASHGWLRARATRIGLPGARSLRVASLRRLAERDHPGAADLLEAYARNVAVGLVNLQQTLAPGLFLLHGDVVAGGERLRGAIERHLLLGVARHPASTPRVRFAEPDRRDTTTLLGGAALVLSRSLHRLA